MPVRCVVALWAAALLVPFAASQAPVQEAAPASQPQSSSSASSGKQKYSHADDFLNPRNGVHRQSSLLPWRATPHPPRGRKEISLGGQHQFARRIRNSRAARYPI